MGFSACDGTRRPLSRSLAGPSKWALHSNAPPAFHRACLALVSFRTWLKYGSFSQNYSVCCILPVQLEDEIVLNCHLIRCQMDTMKTWRQKQSRSRRQIQMFLRGCRHSLGTQDVMMSCSAAWQHREEMSVECWECVQREHCGTAPEELHQWIYSKSW